MSNQEAIALLRNLEDALDSYCELNEEGKTAFRMAIEALSCSENPNNSDCISRQAAIDVLRTCYDTETVTYTNGNEYIDYDQALDLLNSLPSAQPERMRGTWIDYVNSHCECSVCHTEWSYFQNETECFEFCPHCGADMRGEQDDSF